MFMIRFFMPTLVEEKQQILKADLPEFSHSKKPSPIKGIVFCAIFALSALMLSKLGFCTKFNLNSLTIAIVVLFGTAAMFLYPLIYQFGLLDANAFGIYIGSTVHEVAQVVAAGAAVNPDAMDTAVIVKLTRVMMLVPYLFLLTLAMFALGLETNFEKIKNLGIKPLLLAFIMFIWLVGFGFIVNKFII